MYTRHLAATLLLGVLLGCEEPQEPLPLASPLASISDAVHNSGTPGLYFLPPMVPPPKPTPTGPFDAKLDPVVHICELAGAECGPTIATYTRANGPGAERLRVSEQGHYLVDWHTNRFGLDASRTYRVRVLVAGTLLGFADIDVVRTAAQLKGVDLNAYVGVVNGSTLPIRFAIQEGYVHAVGPGGGTISSFDGAVTLTVPAGALSEETGITIAPTTSYPNVPGLDVIAGTAFAFGPDGLTFHEPARLALGYDESNLPAGAGEGSLTLQKAVGTEWQPTGSMLNHIANTVTGFITSFSTYAVVSFPSFPILSGFGTATVDGSVGATEWLLAARVNLSVNLPAGGTAPGTLYVMNDATNLYFALRIQRSAADASSTLQITFDNNNDKFLATGDDRLEVSTTGSSATFTDGFWEVDPFGVAISDVDVNAGGTSEGAGAFSNTGGFSTYEVSHPLNTADNAHDFSLAAANSVAFAVMLKLEDASSNLAQTFYPSTAWGEVLIQPAAPPVMAGSGTAQIDGIIVAGEWDNAACMSFLVPYAAGGGNSAFARFCLMNDNVNYYVAFHYVSTQGLTGNLHVYVDSDNSGGDSNGDDFIFMSVNPANTAQFFDWYVFTGPPCTTVPSCIDYDTANGVGRTDGAAAAQHTGAEGAWEMSHPLYSGDSRDALLSQGDRVGLRAILWIHGDFPMVQLILPEPPNFFTLLIK